VVTRWYRAPEVMLNQMHYTEALDVWSIGCIFGELMMRATLFQGQHNMKQLDKIIEVIGYPSEEDLAFINNEHSLNYLKRIPKKNVTKWEEKMPNANPLAIDLLQKMLSFSPDRRISVEDAIKHPYFKSFLHLGSPPVSETRFDWSWD
jgi:mitogen-activated protein kinase 1/3